MEHQIPQSFKVQWLNTTLKFIKDDTQLVKDYPQMPSSHVEYLHNLIWQRKNDVGLGFKSLYSPVWEAMKVYSVKYRFKIFVEKSEDGMSGHLIMEKIPKTDDVAKEQNDKNKDKKNMCENKERDKHETVQYNEVTKESQTEAVKCKQKKPKKPITETPKMSRGLKKFIENQKMLDSLSPLFIKSTLKSILDFITDELIASKIFSNLAPIESRFLENFFSVYQRRNDFKEMLSPACNEILSEISNCIDNFSKTCSLDITTVGINESTNKREVKFTKVPVFQNKKKAKQKLKALTEKKNTTLLPDDLKFVKNPSISKEEKNIELEMNVSKETQKCKTKILKNSTIFEDFNSKPIDKVIAPTENNVTETLSKFVNKADNVKPKTSTSLKNTSLNKSVILPFFNLPKAETSFIRIDKKSPKKKIVQDTSLPSTTEKALSLLPPKKSISFTKEGTSKTADVPYVRGDQKNPKMKILQDMSVPLTSDKGLRMMQLMGWKGGALGLRGEGITEPIIPIANLNGSGLGHVSVKKDSHKENKKHIESEFVNKILEMIDNDIDVSVINFHNKLIKREIRFWKLAFKVLNERLDLNMDIDKRFELKDKMIRNPDIIFKMDFEDENRKITITKTSKTAVDAKKQTNPEVIDTNLKSKSHLKITVLKSILQLMKSEDNEIVIHFNTKMKTKHIQYSSIIILLINERQIVKQSKNKQVAELSSQVLDAIGDIDLSISIYESEKYIVIRKNQLKSYVNSNNNNINVNKADSAEDNKSAFDNVRSYLPTKKKHKLLNALYKYEMEDTEEFKENQWYSTVDKSLLETKTKLNVNNENRKTIINKNMKSEIKIDNIKNNTRTVEYDKNNNGGISVKVNLNSF